MVKIAKLRSINAIDAKKVCGLKVDCRIFLTIVTVQGASEAKGISGNPTAMLVGARIAVGTSTGFVDIYSKVCFFTSVQDDFGLEGTEKGTLVCKSWSCFLFFFIFCLKIRNSTQEVIWSSDFVANQLWFIQLQG